MYRWTQTLGNNSALKQAIDSVLCAFCYVRPSLFSLLLEWVLALTANANPTTSIFDDHKKSEDCTDDKKSGINTKGWYHRFKLLEHERLHLTEEQLLTVAAAARSPPGIQQLIDCGLPALLTDSITGDTLYFAPKCIKLASFRQSTQIVKFFVISKKNR